MRQGRCDGCGREAMINDATYADEGGRIVLGEFCADCFDDRGLGQIQRLDGHSTHRPDDTDANGGLSNAIKALEEDC